MRRFFIFDKYNTWYDWRSTLTAKDTTDPEPKTNYVELDGANGSLDLTEALTGEIAYSDRTVTASFVTSEGSYADREAVLKQIVASLHGRKVRIIEPDDPEHYFLGRVKVKSISKHEAYAEYTLEAACEPWRYAVNETTRLVQPNGGTVDVVLRNDGVKTVVPVLTVTGSVSIKANGVTTPLTAGSYKITDLRLTYGPNVVTVAGTGTVAFVYREATL